MHAALTSRERALAHGGRGSSRTIAAPLFGEGTIVLTAGTLTEDAQESDQLGGSFFTHYLLSGLRGAADDNGDHIITVAEAFDYTRVQTIRAPRTRGSRSAESRRRRRSRDRCRSRPRACRA